MEKILKDGCKYYCPKCRGETKDFTKRIDKEELKSLLSQKVRGTRNALSVSEFVKVMKQSRKMIFHKDDAPKGGCESQIHAVCLQMIAGRIIALKVCDSTKVGTEKLSKKNVSVVCPNFERKRDGRTLYRIGFECDECWEGFNLW